jgi:hypothetical protein
MFRQSQQLATKYDHQVCCVAKLLSTRFQATYLGFLLLTSHDKKFCRWMNNIDFFEDSRRVVCQSLFSKMIHNEFESSIGAKGCSYDFGEFVDSVDVAQHG